MSVRVRFAPSPTGYLHIGGARTALYNFLFARHEGGKLILRIEDTDQLRSTPESTRSIVEGLRWLGLSFDEGPLFQGERLPLYRRVAEQLEKIGRSYWREDPGKGKALVFRISRESITWEDLIVGPTGRDTSADPDLVILKSDGFPTYNFACVVDDHEMGITHVLRAQEHIPNTPKQIDLFRALDWPLPKYGHFPLIMDPAGGKISKRKKYDFPVTVEECRAMGYLPEAFANFLALLGWSPGKDIEVMTLQEMTEKFTLDRVNASPARFLRDKLDWFNGYYIRQFPLSRLVDAVIPLLASKYSLDGVPREKIEHAVRQQQERLKRLDAITELCAFFFAKEIEFDPSAIEKVLRKTGAADALKAARTTLSQADWTSDQPLEEAIRQAATTLGQKFQDVAQPIRVAVTGRTFSPPIHDTLWLLGRERSLDRIEKALLQVGG